MKSIKDIFDIIGKRKFIERYTSIDPDAGIQSRIAGKDTSGKKESQPRPEEIEQIKSGLKSFINDLKKVLSKL